LYYTLGDILAIRNKVDVPQTRFWRLVRRLGEGFVKSVFFSDLRGFSRTFVEFGLYSGDFAKDDPPAAGNMRLCHVAPI
jgi:hypothetical protein